MGAPLNEGSHLKSSSLLDNRDEHKNSQQNPRNDHHCEVYLRYPVLELYSKCGTIKIGNGWGAQKAALQMDLIL